MFQLNLNNDLITTGPYVKALKELSNKLSVPYAYCCNRYIGIYLAFYQ